MAKYYIYSPDGITIEREKPYYTSKKKALEAFDKFKERYFAQGFYSSSKYGRIPTDSLSSFCKVIIK